MTEARRIISLSSLSELLVVELSNGSFVCKGCKFVALDASGDATMPTVEATLAHLDNHAKGGIGETTGIPHKGAVDAIRTLTMCLPCRGRGATKREVLVEGTNFQRVEEVICQTCFGDGLNEFGKERAKNK